MLVQLASPEEVESFSVKDAGNCVITGCSPWREC